MSIYLLSQVWGGTRVAGVDLPKSQRAVLLVLCDHAHDDGSRCFPSVDLIAYKTLLSPRHVRRALRELEQARIIEPVAYGRGGAGKATEYRIHLEQAPRLPAFAAWKNPDTMSGFTDPQPVDNIGTERPETRTSATENPDTMSPQALRNRHETSVEATTAVDNPEGQNRTVPDGVANQSPTERLARLTHALEGGRP